MKRIISLIVMLMQFSSVLAVFNTRSNAAVISSYRRSDCREGSGIGLLTNQDSGPISSILHQSSSSMTRHKNLINFPPRNQGYIVFSFPSNPHLSLPFPRQLDKEPYGSAATNSGTELQLHIGIDQS